MSEYLLKQDVLNLIEAALDARKTFTIAIDGGSCSGKTTLAREIRERFDCATEFHMDDFYLQAHQRTEARYSEPGGNVDRERFLEEVLLPLVEGREVVYRPLDCSDFSIAEGSVIRPGRLRIIEGAYSHHPALRDYYDYKLFLDIDPEVQRKRLSIRNTLEEQQRFLDTWIPLENAYFQAFDIKRISDGAIKVEE